MRISRRKMRKKQNSSAFVVDSSKSTPCYAGGKKQLPARSKVDKKKAPHYSGSGLPTTQLP